MFCLHFDTNLLNIRAQLVRNLCLSSHPVEALPVELLYEEVLVVAVGGVEVVDPVRLVQDPHHLHLGTADVDHLVLNLKEGRKSIFQNFVFDRLQNGKVSVYHDVCICP